MSSAASDKTAKQREREERLAKALRENLSKRKAAKRAARQPSEGAREDGTSSDA